MGLGDFWIHHLCWGITIDSSLWWINGDSPTQVMNQWWFPNTSDESMVIPPTQVMNQWWFPNTSDESMVIPPTQVMNQWWFPQHKWWIVGLMTFWFGLVSIWSFKDLWPLIFISVTHWITKMRGKCPLNKIMVKTLISDSLKIVHLCWLLNS
jgi:hypothetical protein